MSRFYMNQLSRYHDKLGRSNRSIRVRDIIQYSDILRGTPLQYVVDEAHVVAHLNRLICELSETLNFGDDAGLRVQKSRYVCQYGKIL